MNFQRKLFPRLLPVWMALSMFAVTSLALTHAGAVRAQEHIAAVNSKRIVSESLLARTLADQMERDFKERQQSIDKESDQLKAFAAKQDEAAAKGQPPSLAALQKLNNWNLDLQRKRRDFDEDLSQRRAAALQTVLDKANQAIRKIAIQNNYDLIVQEAVYVNPRIDITDKVMALMAAPGEN